MRLFVAVNFNDDTRSRLLALTDELRSKSERGSFVLPGNLHLTLAFLGECNDNQLNDSITAMEKTTYEPFDMYIDCLGCFKRNDGDLWWAGVRRSDALFNLQRSLSGNLKNAGFRLDDKRYKPHITLGRKVVTDLKPRKIEPFGQKVSKIDLMKSERIDGVLTYASVFMS